MKLTIEISENVYQFVMNTSFVEDERSIFTQSKEDRKKTMILFDILDAIRNGTPLPKGHGDLIDVNRRITVSIYDEQYEEWGEETLTVREALNRWSDEGITIKDIVILADKAESEG